MTVYKPSCVSLDGMEKNDSCCWLVCLSAWKLHAKNENKCAKDSNYIGASDTIVIFNTKTTIKQRNIEKNGIYATEICVTYRKKMPETETTC